MEYKDKLIIANIYLKDKCGLSWNDLPDINSLNDIESREDIYRFCDERLEEAGYPLNTDE